MRTGKIHELVPGDFVSRRTFNLTAECSPVRIKTAVPSGNSNHSTMLIGEYTYRGELGETGAWILDNHADVSVMESADLYRIHQFTATN